MSQNPHYARRTKTDVELMYSLYEANNSLEEIGRRHNLSRERVRQLFAKFGFPIRQQTVSATFRRAHAKRSEMIRASATFLPENKLRKLYEEEKLSIAETARQLKTKPGRVTKSLLHWNISVRGNAEAQRIKTGNPDMNEEALRRLYVTEKKTAREIAEIYECASSTVEKYLGRYGIHKNRGVG